MPRFERFKKAVTKVFVLYGASLASVLTSSCTPSSESLPLLGACLSPSRSMKKSWGGQEHTCAMGSISAIFFLRPESFLPFSVRAFNGCPVRGHPCPLRVFHGLSTPCLCFFLLILGVKFTYLFCGRISSGVSVPCLHLWGPGPLT